MPLSCKPRKWNERTRGTLDDILGGYNIIFSYSLTYVDLIDTLAVMGYKKEFKKAVSKLPKLISFDRDIDISVYLLFY